MSYILDALRRADAERERGSVPGIHAQPLAAVLPADGGSRLGTFGGLDGGTRRWLLGGAAVGIALAALLIGRVMTAAPPPSPPEAAAPQATAVAAARDDPPPAPAAPAEVPVATWPDAAADTRLNAPIGKRPAAARAVGPAGGTTAPAATAATTPRAPAATLAAGPPASATAGRAGTTPPVADNSSAATAVAPSRLAAAPTTADVTTPPTDNNSSRVYQPRELPDDIRRELPTLSINGASYSENAASRMLIINGQVFHENDKLAADLVLERIQLRSAVLRYKGFRYSIAY